MTPENNRRRAGDTSGHETDSKVGRNSTQANGTVLAEMQRAQELGLTLTIWDLPQATGLALHEAFAAVRRLEADQIIDIGDNPSDPFGATLRLRKVASKSFRKPSSV